MRKVLLYLIFASITISIFSCSDPVTGDLQNIPPDTHLTLFPDSVIAPGSTLRKIAWWGDDADGFVAGYYFSFDSTLPVSSWTFTDKSDSTFLLQMNGNDTTFRFYVAAVDDKGEVDPSPASNLYPTINSAPSMQFVSGTEIPDTIYPVATFKWSATDPDGNSTIRYFYWSLNDTNHFNRLDGAVNIMTLVSDSGLVLNSANCLYMRVQDNAGAYSPVVRMPADTNDYFFVKKVNSKILLIKDMPLAELNTLSAFYKSAMDTIRYDSLDIKTDNGKFIPKIINPMFVETLNLYDIVIWSAGRGNVSADNANFDLAQRSLPYFTQAGGKLFFTTGFPNVETQTQGSLINFAPIDSIAFCTIPFLSNISLVN
ncbi:MAG: hypothetical protein L0Y76_02325, partial [Ignavibacteria bacterium]|nr:hypothetical protein [Ignavibacteria bacterium]